MAVPAPPEGLLPSTVQVWETYWADQVAGATTPVDHGALRRYILYLDEWERCMAAVRRPNEDGEVERLVKGSTGQPRINPLAEQALKLEGVLSKLEADFGLTPLARMRLGIAIGQARMTVAELNRMAEEPNGDSDQAEAEVIEGWQEA